MAENDQEKTEQKSQKKWEEARDKGELPKSQEIATFAVFCVIILYFTAVRTLWFDSFGSIMTDHLQFERHLGLELETLSQFLFQPVWRTTVFLGPFFLVIIVVSATISLSQTGFSFAKNRMELNWGKLDPIKGAKKFTSLRSWVDGLKSVSKILLFAYLSYITLSGEIESLIDLPGRDLRYQINYLIAVTLKIALRVTLLMAAFSVADYAYQWWQFQQTLRMTAQEAKEELKAHEGDPLIKQRVRSIRMEMARKRMMSDAATADVIVTNPTHYAVALAFNRDKAPAPYVVAMGKQYLAARIRQTGKDNGVPIIENPPMARALFRKAKVGQVIPSDFFRAVAELLAFVYLLKHGGRVGGFGSSRRPRLKADFPRVDDIDD